MADNPDANAGEDQETEALRRDLANLRAVLAERRDDLVQSASRATQAIVAPIRENPGLVSSAFAIGGVVGLLIGLALGQSEQRSRHWYDRYH